ncbi:hypothetical protein HK100_011138 [Physocladia obscura]|uniref:Laccase n=1 Tax=Physocladia obscura TaxID=109957 RepID=A0AAD5T2A9_9FUNG|nr:hypothetical protein HK100_011138 [Physocladia obscura]
MTVALGAICLATVLVLTSNESLSSQKSLDKLTFSASQLHTRTISLNWTATNFSQNLDGVERYALGINNVPGHLTFINANVGDRIRIYFTNALSEPTSLHFHGMLQNGTGFMDGPSGITQCPVAPGQTYVYDFNITTTAGTYWWHAHYRMHLADGLRGPFIVSDPNEVKNYDSEAILQLSDWYHDQSENLLAWYLNNATNPGGNEPVFDSGLVNGIGQFNCSQAENVTCSILPQPYIQTVPVGCTVRIRVVNTAAFAAFLFSIDGHELTVIEVDGVLVQPYQVDMLTINVAQRYSVLITTSQAVGNYYINAQMYHGDPWTSMPSMPAGFNPNLIAILNYAGVNLSTAPFVTAAKQSPIFLDDMNLVPLQIITAPDRSPSDTLLLFEFLFTMKGTDTYQRAYPTISRYSRENLAWMLQFSSSFTTNSSTALLIDVHDSEDFQPTFEPSVNPIILEKNKIIDIIIRNDDPGEHPFHIHGHVFWVLASGVATSLNSIPSTFDLSNPLRRDTVTVQACPHDSNGCFQNGNQTSFGYVVIRFVADNPGVWLMHCHIAWHMSAGLAISFVETLDGIRNLAVVDEVRDTCAAFESWKNSGDLEIGDVE